MWLTILATIKNHLEVVILAAMLFAPYEYGAYVERKSCVAAANALAAQQQENVIAAQDSIIKKAAVNTTINNEVSHGLQSHYNVIDTVYAAALDSLRDTPGSASSSALPAISTSANGYNDRAKANGFSNRSKERLLALARDADIQTQQLVACQGWIAAHQNQ